MDVPSSTIDFSINGDVPHTIVIKRELFMPLIIKASQ